MKIWKAPGSMMGKVLSIYLHGGYTIGSEYKLYFNTLQ